MSSLIKIYDRLFSLLEECKYAEDNKDGFVTISKIYKDFNADSNVQPAAYLIIDESIPSPHLTNGTDVYETTFDIHIHANKNEDYPGSLYLINLVNKIKYTFAKPLNYSSNHLGMPGEVFDTRVTNIMYYDDVVGDNNLAAVVSIAVLHNDEVIERDFKKQKY